MHPGRGTIISMLLVMGILPGILLLGDTIIDRTTFNIKYPAIVQTTEAVGMVRLDGGSAAQFPVRSTPRSTES